CARLATDYW
nr:immunoglobulin heavy chain junction region [Mus musculus]NSM04371.1 immunoglobulin heavy chain junction region [Mus musculus]NSM04400.1 immunoglobulin heavy chain junction region [Mus musculus]NSM04633.1 immunoglobulin heavy chain junction region [Mus musculus]NSM06134.1 immunoglobulin heavy chain junction region [Mus musculus]